MFLLGGRLGFIKIRMKLVNFIKKFSSKTTFIKTTFIKNHFHQKPLSSKTTCIKKTQPKDLNPEPQKPKPQTLNPKPQNPKTPKPQNPKTPNPKPRKAGISRVPVKASPAFRGRRFHRNTDFFVFTIPIVFGSVPTLNLMCDENGFW